MYCSQDTIKMESVIERVIVLLLPIFYRKRKC